MEGHSYSSASRIYEHYGSSTDFEGLHSAMLPVSLLEGGGEAVGEDYGGDGSQMMPWLSSLMTSPVSASSNGSDRTVNSGSLAGIFPNMFPYQMMGWPEMGFLPCADTPGNLSNNHGFVFPLLPLFCEFNLLSPTLPHQITAPTGESPDVDTATAAQSQKIFKSGATKPHMQRKRGIPPTSTKAIIRRPPNSFIIYRREKHAQVLQQNRGKVAVRFRHFIISAVQK